MQVSEVRRAVAAAASITEALGLTVDDVIVLQNSNKVALRLLPCDVFARVAHEGEEVAQCEVDLAEQLPETDSPVAALEPRVEPRVYRHDGFAVTLWTYYESTTPAEISAAEYAKALERLHAGLRQTDFGARHFTDRVTEARRVVADPEESPELLDADRELLAATLARLSASIRGRDADEQLLHGEPHLGNVLRARDGLRFIDLETCCRGPIEFDIAHALVPSGDGRLLAADEVSEHYPAANRDLVEQCRILIWAMITTWRWRRGDQLPNGRYWATEGLNQLREALDR
jgi:Ser/Thr protein kinase RdoA (MazF antagonist)